LIKSLCSALLVLNCLGLAVAREDDNPAKGALSDEQFVQKASASDLAEVNLGNLAAKQASSEAVRKFAKHMVEDHTKSSREMLKLANNTKFTVASTMDAEHERLFRKLSSMRGAAFDREYMAGQVKDHKVAVSLYERATKNVKNEDLKKFAGKTLPVIRKHLKMAQQTHKNLKDDSGDKGKE